MKKNLLLISIAIVSVLVLYAVWLQGQKGTAPSPHETTTGQVQGETPLPGLGTTPLNSTYGINDQPVTLENGMAEQEIMPNSATKIRTNMFSEPVIGDVNGDGIDDAVVLLTYNPGGSGTFYYIAAALVSADGYKGTNAVLIGDRIVPKEMQIERGNIVCIYLDRAPEEPYSARPSREKKKYFRVRDSVLTEDKN